MDLARGAGPTRQPRGQRERLQGFEREVVAGLAALPPAPATPRQVLAVAAPAAVRHGIDARGLMQSLARILNRDWPRLPRLLHVEWRRLFDQTPWLKTRGQFLYREHYRPFPDAPWGPARNLRLRRLRIETPRLALGAQKQPYRPKWWEITWKRDLVVGELRVQQRRLFPNAPKWSPLHGRSLPALRFTTRKSTWQRPAPERDRDQGHAH
jgi:hypothetical protein